jgi:hypothetical protein
MPGKRMFRTRIFGFGMLRFGVLRFGMLGQDMQRSSPRPTIVDVGGLELSVRSGLV